MGEHGPRAQRATSTTGRSRARGSRPTAGRPHDLREVVLAASVLHDLDVTPTDAGPEVAGAEGVVLVPWTQVRRAVAGTEDTREGAARVAALLALHVQVAAAGERLPGMLRPVGVPCDAPDHPGMEWVRARVLGDALELGPGFVGLDPAREEDVVVVPVHVLRTHGVDLDSALWVQAWATALDVLERMGALAAERLVRDPERPLSPYGDCDVLTLLGSRALRAALARPAGGLRTVAVPMRTRGWTDLRRLDPAYAVAAAAAAPDGQAGFARPLLVSPDEVVQAPPGGRPHAVDLLDPAPASRRHDEGRGTLL